jgi:hypothetical protein
MIRVAVANSNRIVTPFAAEFTGVFPALLCQMPWVEFAGKVTIYGKKIDNICQFNDFSLCR